MNTFGLYAVNMATAQGAPELFICNAQNTRTHCIQILALCNMYAGYWVLKPEWTSTVLALRMAGGLSLAATAHFGGDFKGRHRHFYSEMRTTGLAQFARGALESFPAASPVVTLADLAGSAINLWTLSRSKYTQPKISTFSRVVIHLSGLLPVLLAIHPHGNSLRDLRTLAQVVNNGVRPLFDNSASCQKGV